MAMIAKTSSNVDKSVLCDSDGKLLVGGISITSVTVSIVPSTSIVAYTNTPTVPSSATTTLLDYTNTTGGLVLLDGFNAAGEVDAEYQMLINGTKKMVLWSSEQDRNVQFYLPTPMRVENNGSITIKVTSFRGITADYNCSLFAHRS